AHAQNLRDSGARVVVGARTGRDAEARAIAEGFEVFGLAEAAARASVVAVLLPDEVAPSVWPMVFNHLVPDVVVVFAHGFNLLYHPLAFPQGADVVLVSPTGPGRVLRSVYEQGDGLPAYLAVHQDGTGNAWSAAEHYATLLGCARAQLWRTTVREETEVDLFGEQSVLCGGMNELVTAAWETLVARGFSPEIAYLECVHQLKYLADLLHERGVSAMRAGISGTACFGDITRGSRVINAESRRQMAAMLDEITSGAFAREWIAEAQAGRPRLDAALARARAHPMEAARRRALGLADPPV
ncbi:MAG: ketol-acid reductoisomerase, partial [Candidatus Eisenbacteria bacterium]